jgi:hypothetical protein
MKKADMIKTLKARIEKKSDSALSWNKMLNNRLNSMDTNFEEAIENETIFKMVEYRAWVEDNEVLYQLKELLTDFLTK